MVDTVTFSKRLNQNVGHSYLKIKSSFAGKYKNMVGKVAFIVKSLFYSILPNIENSLCDKITFITCLKLASL